MNDLHRIADQLDEALDGIREGAGDPLAAIEMLAMELRGQSLTSPPFPWDAWHTYNDWRTLHASSSDLVNVQFWWSPRHGWCYECGLPAAFYLPVAYINRERTPDAPDEPPTDTNKRCGVCAANAAADGEIVRRIESEDS